VTSRRDAFYIERDRRTRQYGGTDDALERPVLIVVGTDAARTAPGRSPPWHWSTWRLGYTAASA
jgi:hypothetical protein